MMAAETAEALHRAVIGLGGTWRWVVLAVSDAKVLQGWAGLGSSVSSIIFSLLRLGTRTEGSKLGTLSLPSGLSSS
jgi:hypothetical protein